MNIKPNIKYLWLAGGIFSLVLTGFLWFGFESDNLQNTILALDALMFILSVPCSLFFHSGRGGSKLLSRDRDIFERGNYLNTVFLFVLGLMQWFWLARFWYPTESVYQKLDLIKD